MTPRESRRVWYVLAAVAIVAFVAFGATSFTSSLTPYVTYAEARSSTSQVQITGALEQGSLDYDDEQQLLRFTLIEDTTGETMRIAYSGTKPGNFEEATMIVAIGRFDGGELAADKLLVKCPSKYQGVESEGDVKEYS